MVDPNTVRCLVASNGTSGWTAANDVDYDFLIDTWYNMTMTFDGSTMLIYVNSLQIKSSVVTGTIITNANTIHVISGSNDTGNKLVCFVNGSTRTADGGASGLTFRNDGGPLTLGSLSYASSLYGSTMLIDASSGITLSGTTTISGGTGTITLSDTGDIYAYRSGGTTGVIFLNSAGNRYLYYDGTSYQMPGSGLTLGGTINASQLTISADTLNRFSQGSAVLRNASPTMYFRDTDQMSAMLHCNSNLFYILRGGIDTETWTQINGQWPVTIDLSNNNATFGAAVSAIGEVTAYASDLRLKENIKNIPNALDKVLQLNGVTFSWIDKTEDIGFAVVNKDDVGVIAQEVKKVLPEAVRFAPFDQDEKGNSRSGENYLTVQYEKLTALLIEAVKEQQGMIDELKARISALESDKN